MTKTVAVVGLGKMGWALAERLLDQGIEPVVWNRTHKDLAPLTSKGARVVASPNEVWSSTDVAITFVSNDDALREVCNGNAGLGAPGASGRTVIDMSTVSPHASAEVGARLQAAGIGFLRSPVSGNPGVLAAGNLTLMVSGSNNSYSACDELLHQIGANVFYLGEGETSRVVKLAINALLAATTAAVAETIVLCEAAGLDRSRYLEVLSESSVGSPFVKYKRPPLEARDYNATFTTDMLSKDLGLAEQLAKEYSIPMPTTNAVHALIKSTSDYGLGGLDFMAMLPYLQHEAHRTPDVEP